MSDIYEPFVRPFTYDEDGIFILDANGNKVIDIRGWGYLTGKGSGALGWGDEKAIEVQDAIGKRIVTLMNEDTNEK